MNSPDHIITDIAKKCGDDVGDVIRRNLRLVSGPRAAIAVSFDGACMAMATHLGAFTASVNVSDMTDEQVVDGVLALIRESMVKAMPIMREVKANG